MARWPEGRVRLVAEPIEPPEVGSITSRRPLSVVKARSVSVPPVKSAATIESGWAPEETPLPAAEITGVAKVPLPAPV